MNKSCYGLMLASSLVVAGNALAEEKKTEEEKSPWTSSLELGFVRTTGNTETQTTIGKFDIAYAAGNWKHTGHAEGYGQQSENDLGVSVVSAERYEIMGKSDYKFTDRDYAFGLIRLQKDRFSGFEYENVLSLGYGRKVILKDNMELDLEIGPGIKFFKVDNAAESQDEALLVLAANYWWAITDTSKFIQELRTDIGEDFTSSRSVTGIQANINKTLALRFTYTIRHKSEVPDPTTTEKMDTEAAMSLVYNF
jgi:putative salt-induced outer membrane protein